MIPCRFFAQGRCARGKSCRFTHALSTGMPTDEAEASMRAETITWRPDAPCFEPNPVLGSKSAAASKDEITLTAGLANVTISEEYYSKELNGATILFAPGAEVSDVKLESDFSTIQILGLPPTVRPGVISGFLEGLGFSVEHSAIKIKPIGVSGAVAEVKMEDPKFAETVSRKFDKELGRGQKGELSVKVLQRSAGSSEGLMNRLQMNTVTCTWYKPSQVAWLHYDDYELAKKARGVLTKRGTILDRKIQCTLQEPDYIRAGTIISLQATNLDVLTTKTHFNRLLRGSLTPEKVVFGKKSHTLSEVEAGNIVESLLKKHGDLEVFELHSLPTSAKMAAKATFLDKTKALEAAHTLNNKKIKELGNSTLFINNVISIKYNVLNTIYQSVRPALDHLKEEVWQPSHIHLKSYTSLDPRKPFTTVRLSGEDLKQLAKSKASLERVLAGTVVLNGDVPLWDAYFLTPASLIFLNGICATNELYIHRDARKCQLLMYGGRTEKQKAAQEALLAKIRALQVPSNIIILEGELLKKALQGGWRRIKSSFGAAASLNISNYSKVIMIQGSAQDYQRACALLYQDSDDLQLATPSDGNCLVCWEETEEPLKTPCGHTYCKDCFRHQCSSASNGTLPVRCHGDNSRCQHIFSINNLKEMLEFSAFDDLLNASFKSHIRTHPAEFQYCPTPDCPQIYRLTADGCIFVCPACLTSVCTTCNGSAHDGMSCDEFKDLDSEDGKRFAQWKKDNDARPCPSCKITIVKSHGCNHMVCLQCKAHICWFCMEVFETSAACYRHMSREHRDIY